jgi:hypothetical protein
MRLMQHLNHLPFDEESGVVVQAATPYKITLPDGGY